MKNIIKFFIICLLSIPIILSLSLLFMVQVDEQWSIVFRVVPIILILALIYIDYLLIRNNKNEIVNKNKILWLILIIGSIIFSSWFLRNIFSKTCCNTSKEKNPIGQQIPNI